MVHIPSALLLFAIVAAGAALGVGGTILAAPLTVVAFVLVQKLYVRDALGEQAMVPGEGGAPRPGPSSHHRKGD